jgi:hypothetical protein
MSGFRLCRMDSGIAEIICRLSPSSTPRRSRNTIASDTKPIPKILNRTRRGTMIRLAFPNQRLTPLELAETQTRRCYPGMKGETGPRCDPVHMVLSGIQRWSSSSFSGLCHCMLSRETRLKAIKKKEQRINPPNRKCVPTRMNLVSYEVTKGVSIMETSL